MSARADGPLRAGAVGTQSAQPPAYVFTRERLTLDELGHGDRPMVHFFSDYDPARSLCGRTLTKKCSYGTPLDCVVCAELDRVLPRRRFA